MVLGQAAEARPVRLDEGLGARRVQGVQPHRGPGAPEVPHTRGPSIGSVEVEADRRIVEPELGVLLDEIGDLIAREVAADHVRAGLANLQDERAEVGDVGGDQLVADQLGPVGVEEVARRPQQVVAEHVVGGQREEALAVDHAVPLQRLADGVDHHGVGDVGAEHVATAMLAAQHVRARTEGQEQALVALGDLGDGQGRGRADLAHDVLDPVALQHALRLGRGVLGVDRVLRADVEHAPADAAGGVDLLHGKLHAPHRILAERAEKAGHRRQVADADRPRLRAHDGRHADRRGGDEAGTEPDGLSPIQRSRRSGLRVLGHLGSSPSLIRRRLLPLAVSRRRACCLRAIYRAARTARNTVVGL